MKNLSLFINLLVFLFLCSAVNAQFNSERTWGTYWGGQYIIAKGAVKDGQNNVYLATTV